MRTVTKISLAGIAVYFFTILFSKSLDNFLEYSPPPEYNTINREDDYRSAADYLSTKSKSDSSIEQIAFFLQIQQSTLQLLPRLFNRIYHPENIYIVHFDTDVEPDEGIEWLLRGNVSVLPGKMPRNVRIMPSETVNYMGISMTLNTINALQVALDFSPKWRYFINISGNDYPLVSADLIRKLLSHKGQSREFFCFEPLKRRFWNRFSYFNLDSALDLKNMKKPVYEGYIPNPLAFFSRSSILKAEAWMIVSRQFAKFITHSSFARRALLLFSYSIMSDEMYFPTVARNTLFNTLTVNTCMRQIKWHDGMKWSGQHPFFLDDLYDENLDNAYESQEKLQQYTSFFARKFRRTNSTYMDLIDEARNKEVTVNRVSEYFRDELEWRR